MNYNGKFIYSENPEVRVRKLDLPNLGENQFITLSGTSQRYAKTKPDGDYLKSNSVDPETLPVDTTSRAARRRLEKQRRKA